MIDRKEEGALPNRVSLQFRTPVVCLCRSTRFKDAFIAKNKELTFKGEIVLTVGCFPHTDDGGEPEQVLGEDLKKKLDWLHKQKILLADYILVLNVSGYIGSSTKSEIEFARNIGTPIEYLEAPAC